MTNIGILNISILLYRHHIPIFPRLLNRILRVLYSCEIPNSVSFGENIVFSHKGLGVVIGHDTVIGNDCKILHNVTIGGRSGIRANPRIGDNVLIGAGAILLGDITVGNNVKIGAGSVVVHDIEDNQVVVGNPAKAVKKSK